ncbi:hypothetical protein PAPYR_8227 [Paratrimastix pyriformis]|uniref:SMP-LTD domain-containing protein n=1 Tax=Paratrimastix pyriformis TaxID=342808 RepID=A0ABQ8UF54_9EUKA|nr:hypothetical protein PAPYR_8227 [Paratrimastix pyriformis]
MTWFFTDKAGMIRRKHSRHTTLDQLEKVLLTKSELHPEPLLEGQADTIPVALCWGGDLAQPEATHLITRATIGPLLDRLGAILSHPYATFLERALDASMGDLSAEMLNGLLPQALQGYVHPALDHRYHVRLDLLHAAFEVRAYSYSAAYVTTTSGGDTPIPPATPEVVALADDQELALKQGTLAVATRLAEGAGRVRHTTPAIPIPAPCVAMLSRPRVARPHSLRPPPPQQQPLDLSAAAASTARPTSPPDVRTPGTATTTHCRNARTQHASLLSRYEGAFARLSPQATPRTSLLRSSRGGRRGEIDLALAAAAFPPFPQDPVTVPRPPSASSQGGERTRGDFFEASMHKTAKPKGSEASRLGASSALIPFGFLHHQEMFPPLATVAATAESGPIHSFHFQITRSVYQVLQKISLQQKPGCIESGFIAALELLLFRYWRDNNFSVGIPFALTQEGTETIVENFQADISTEDMSFVDLWRLVERRYLSIRSHSGDLPPARQPSYVAFKYANSSVSIMPRPPRLFSFSIFMGASIDMEGLIEWTSPLLTEAIVHKVGVHYARLLRTVVNKCNMPMREVQVDMTWEMTAAPAAPAAPQAHGG